MKLNSSIKRIVSSKHISIESTKNISHSSIEKNESIIKNGSKKLIGSSIKKIVSHRHIQLQFA